MAEPSLLSLVLDAYDNTCRVLFSTDENGLIEGQDSLWKEAHDDAAGEMYLLANILMKAEFTPAECEQINKVLEGLRRDCSNNEYVMQSVQMVGSC